MARFNSKYTKLTVITCYALIEDAEEEKKDSLYDQLQQAIQEVPSHDVLCVFGDLNACIGKDNEGREKLLVDHWEERVWQHQRQRTQTPRPMCEEQLGHWWNPIPAQRNPQDDMDIPRRQDTHADLSRHH